MVNNNPGAYTYSSVDEGLEMIATDRKIMHVRALQLRGFLAANPFFDMSLSLFGRERPYYGGVILNKNSPLTPLINTGLRRVMEGASGRKLMNKWLGHKLKNSRQSDGRALGLGQVSGGLFFIIFGLTLSCILLSLEITIKKKRSN